MEPSLWDALAQLFTALWQLFVLLWTFAWHWVLLIIWVTWWLCAVNWSRLWAFLHRGAWAPLLLLVVLAALVWSRVQPGPANFLGIVSVPNFWWQLGYVGMLGAVALFCGWLQGLLGWQPDEVSFDPPADSHAHAHH